MILHPDLADQDIEEVAEELWTLDEQGLDRIEDLRASSEGRGARRRARRARRAGASCASRRGGSR